MRPHPSALPGGPESEGANAVLAPDQQSKADVEWDASSDRSFEDKKMASSDNYFSGGNRGGNRGSGRYNGGANMGNNRQANIKEGAKQLVWPTKKSETDENEEKTRNLATTVAINRLYQ